MAAVAGALKNALGLNASFQMAAVILFISAFALLRLAALTDALLLVLAAFVLGDREAFAFGILALVAYNTLDRAIRTHQRFKQVETKEFRIAALYEYICPALPAHRTIRLSIPQLLVGNRRYHCVKKQKTGSIQKRSDDNGDRTPNHQIL